MVLAEFGSGQAFLTIMYIFLFAIWFWLLITIFSDLFRDHEMNGWGKAAWGLFVIILPFLGILVYMIVRGSGMADRAIQAQQKQQEQFDSYVRKTAGPSGGDSGGGAEEIARAKALLDDGSITQEEFESLKAKALG